MTETVLPTQPIQYCRKVIAACCAGVFCWFALVMTSSSIPITWDEGDYLERANSISQWSRDVVKSKGAKRFFTKKRLEDSWQTTTVREGHPAGFLVVIAAGKWLAPNSWDELTQARIGPMLLFSIAVGCLFYRLATDYSWMAACWGTLALVSMPRMFSHAHFATQDGQLTAVWILAWCCFNPSKMNVKNVLLWGFLLGLSCSIKFTGWFLFVPFGLWLVFYGNKRLNLMCCFALIFSLFTFIAFNPPLWLQIPNGLYQHFALNLSRADNQLNITGYFLGRLYDLHHPLPWYNTLLWTAITVPLGTLLFAIIGLGRSLTPQGILPESSFKVDPAQRMEENFLYRKCFYYLPQPDRALLLLIWVTLIIVRALPGAPTHDGIRLFLPSFAFVAIFAGLGCEQLWNWMLERTNAAVGKLVAGGMIACWMIGSATSVVWYFPQNLSYYNLTVNGLSGATEIGMEPTYWWDSLDDEVLVWLHENTAKDEKIHFSPYSPTNMRLLQKWGKLQRNFAVKDPGVYKFYVMQYRPSAMKPVDWELLQNYQPVYEKYIQSVSIREMSPGAWKLDTPLIQIYTMDDYFAAQQQVQQSQHEG